MTVQTMRAQTAPIHAAIAERSPIGDYITPLVNIHVRDMFIHDLFKSWNDTKDDETLLAARDLLAATQTVVGCTIAASVSYTLGDLLAARDLAARVLSVSDYSLARLIRRAMDSQIPAGLWIDAVLDTDPDTISANYLLASMDTSPTDSDGLTPVSDESAPVALTLTSPAQLVANLRTLVSDLRDGYYAVLLQGDDGVVCGTLTASNAFNLPLALSTYAGIESADRCVLLSVNSAQIGSYADLISEDIFVWDTLVVNTKDMTWRSEMCANESCCPQTGTPFTWAQA